MNPHAEPISTGWPILSELKDKIADLKQALKKHKKNTVYNQKLKAKLNELVTFWDIVKRSIPSSLVKEILSESYDPFDVIKKHVTGTRPRTKQLRQLIKDADNVVTRLKINVEAQFASPEQLELKKKIEAIKDPILKEIMGEAFNCWRVGSSRACIILSWCAVEAKIFDIYRRRFKIEDIKKLIPEANQRKIQYHDDLAMISDTSLLLGLREAGLLTQMEFRILDDVCRTYRNIAAHASQKKSFTDSEVASVVHNMITFIDKEIG